MVRLNVGGQRSGMTLGVGGKQVRPGGKRRVNKTVPEGHVLDVPPLLVPGTPPTPASSDVGRRPGQAFRHSLLHG